MPLHFAWQILSHIAQCNFYGNLILTTLVILSNNNFNDFENCKEQFFKTAFIQIFPKLRYRQITTQISHSFWLAISKISKLFLSLSYRPTHEPLIFKRTFIHHAERNKLVFVHSQSTSRPVKLLANFQMQIPHSTFILYSLLKFCKMDKSHFVKILLIYIYIS